MYLIPRLPYRRHHVLEADSATSEIRSHTSKRPLLFTACRLFRTSSGPYSNRPDVGRPRRRANASHRADGVACLVYGLAPALLLVRTASCLCGISRNLWPECRL